MIEYPSKPTSSQYRSLRIRGFRGLGDVHLKNLDQINIVLGPNNSRKTTVLEAVYSHASGLNFPPVLTRIAGHRSDQSFESFFDMGEAILSLYAAGASPPLMFELASVMSDETAHVIRHEFSPSAELATINPRAFGDTEASDALTIEEQSSETGPVGRAHLGSVTLTYNETVKSIVQELPYPPRSGPDINPLKLAVFAEVLDHRRPSDARAVFAQLKRYGEVNNFCKELALAFPGCEEIDLVPYPDGSAGQVYIRFHDTFMPLRNMGDGLRRWFSLVGRMFTYPGAVHCIEEMDATFNPRVMRTLGQAVLRYARQLKNQLFLTTHNIEFLDAFLQGVYELELAGSDPIRVISLSASPRGATRILSMSGREALDRRDQFDQELR